LRCTSTSVDRPRLTAGTRDLSALWQEIRTIGREFQQGLLALLFETPLRSIAPEYAVF